MSWIWRLLVVVLVIGGIALWVPSYASEMAVANGADGSVVYAPAAANDNDPCLSGDPRKQKKCHYNTPNFPQQSGAPGQNGSLTVEIHPNNDHPVAGSPFQIVVSAYNAPISSLEWWTDGNASPSPLDDALGWGVNVLNCGGATSCSQTWTALPRNLGWYIVRARAVDTSGNVAQSFWQFLASDNPR